MFLASSSTTAIPARNQQGLERESEGDTTGYEPFRPIGVIERRRERQQVTNPSRSTGSGVPPGVWGSGTQGEILVLQDCRGSVFSVGRCLQRAVLSVSAREGEKRRERYLDRLTDSFVLASNGLPEIVLASSHLPANQGHNLALIVWNVPSSLESGPGPR